MRKDKNDNGDEKNDGKKGIAPKKKTTSNMSVNCKLNVKVHSSTRSII